MGRIFMYVAAPAGYATATPYGAGCYNRHASFYETFQPGTFDLSNSSIRLTAAGGSYVVIPGSTNWFTPVAANLGLTDDSVSGALALPFTLNYPGGSTTNLYASSNGFIWAQANTNNGCCTGDPVTLLTLGARWCPLWNDLNPSAGGTVTFDVDAPNGVAYVTWSSVPEYGTTNLENFQVAFYSSGDVEYRYQSCSILSHVLLTGFSPGANNSDPGIVDISASLPIITYPVDVAPLALAAAPRPVTGNTVVLTTSNVPANSAIGATILSFTQYNPGLDLSGLGMPGCRQFVALDSSQLFLPSGGTGSTSFTVPNNPVYAGMHVYAQSAAFSPGANVLGVLSSNGLDLLVGTL
jgi:hypothetical protein